ncbi:caspase family protein [Streptomyces sp. NPDC000594]|uniref:caspase family protein n=1 Tax=Streptomyces sp. NPDC000594 TaxID=3154261 RepID=UPI00332A0657
MATGRSLHLGLNSVDPARYGGWDGRLLACENDARDMERLARGAGFETKVLLTPECTVENVVTELGRVVRRSAPGDIVLLTYSGHGGQVPDLDEDESDRLDETLVLYDREFLDDEVRRELAHAADGVRILVFLDCCHSGTAVELPVGAAEGGGFAPRMMPPDRQREIFERDRELYRDIQRSLAEDGGAAEADVLLISACQDHQVAADGPVNGRFTETLLEVWGGGYDTGGYRAFHQDILRRMPRDQSPNLHLSGQVAGDFLDQRPFTV